MDIESHLKFPDLITLAFIINSIPEFWIFPALTKMEEYPEEAGALTLSN